MRQIKWNTKSSWTRCQRRWNLPIFCGKYAFSLAGEGKGKGREAPEESNCNWAKRSDGIKGFREVNRQGCFWPLPPPKKWSVFNAITLYSVWPKPARKCWRAWENPKDPSLAMCSSQWIGELGQIHHITLANRSQGKVRIHGRASQHQLFHSSAVKTCTNSHTFVCRMTASERQKSPTEVVRMLGAEWKGMSEAQKQPYLEKYEKLKVCSYIIKKKHWCSEAEEQSYCWTCSIFNKYFWMMLSLRKYTECSGGARQGDGEVDREDDKGGEDGGHPGGAGQGDWPQRKLGHDDVNPNGVFWHDCWMFHFIE